jgi:hypothetical protein
VEEVEMRTPVEPKDWYCPTDSRDCLGNLFREEIERLNAENKRLRVELAELCGELDKAANASRP